MQGTSAHWRSQKHQTCACAVGAILAPAPLKLTCSNFKTDNSQLRLKSPHTVLFSPCSVCTKGHRCEVNLQERCALIVSWEQDIVRICLCTVACHRKPNF